MSWMNFEFLVICAVDEFFKQHLLPTAGSPTFRDSSCCDRWLSFVQLGSTAKCHGPLLCFRTPAAVEVGINGSGAVQRSIWGFPKIGVPGTHHPCWWDFPLQTIYFGGTPIYGNHHIIYSALCLRVIGGGPTGVEVAADLADFLSGDAKEAQL